jgi:hypothetical protein
MRECNFQVPDSDTIANLYVTIYEEDHEDSISLVCGILAAKYYINAGSYRQASELLTSIVSIVRDLSYESEFMTFFLDVFRCWGELVYRDNVAEEIIDRCQLISISELQRNAIPEMEHEIFARKDLTFLHGAMRKRQGRQCALVHRYSFKR